MKHNEMEFLAQTKSDLWALIFAFLYHLIDGLLSHHHCLDTGRGATVDCCLQNSLSDFYLCKTVVYSTTGVQSKFKPCLLSNDDSNIYKISPVYISDLRLPLMYLTKLC
jgi:hypothetical protein